MCQTILQDVRKEAFQRHYRPRLQSNLSLFEFWLQNAQPKQEQKTFKPKAE